MSFNSFTFLLFFLIFFALWIPARSYRIPRLSLLFAGSCIFYGWWDWRFLFLIFYTGTVDFLLALLMEKCSSPGKRKAVLALSIVNAAGALSVFKYSVFFAGILNHLAGWFGLTVHLEEHIPAFCLILPVGISFFTFQSMSYTIDVFRKELKPTRSWLQYMAYLIMFPQLVAGPIVRAKTLLVRIGEKPDFRPGMMANGMKLVILGFFRKCMIADNIAVFADTYFDNYTFFTNGREWWIVMILFSIQIYCDFAGYSDIARGLIKILGYRFDLNFNYPYMSCSIREFWTRWHISLSSWFRDYVYFPLGGSRGGKHPVLKGIRNCWITMLLSGLWHGAAWNFVIWGGLHAFCLTLERFFHYPELLKRSRIGHVLLYLVVQIQVIVAWVFFRSRGLDDAFLILKRMFTLSAGTAELRTMVWFYIALFAVTECLLFFRPVGRLRHVLPRFYAGVSPYFWGILAVMTLFFRGAGNVFVYFQF